MSTVDLYTSLTGLWITFQENHTKYNEKGNKAAAQRARKSLGDN